MVKDWRTWALLAAALASTGCTGRGGVGASTTGWIRVETDDLLIRTDIDPEDAIELAIEYQRLRTAIGENEFPCAFEHANAPMEFVILKSQDDIDRLGRRNQGGLFVPPPSELLDAKAQLVMSRRVAGSNTQLFVHELTHGAVAMCFPEARPWFHEGMASFYETARIREGELVLGMPAFAFVSMENVEPYHDIYPVVVNGAEIWVLPKRRLPDFDALRRMTADQFYFSGKRRSVADLQNTTAHYAGSWLAIHLLQFGAPALSARFAAYLAALGRGETDDIAWQSSFGGLNLDPWVEKYLNADYGIATHPIANAEPREPVVGALSSTEVALLWARLYGWQSDTDAEVARAYLDFASETSPESPEVTLHWSAFEAGLGAVDAADARIARALELAPSDPDV
ncbi:MAG: hypothetical protein WBG86_15420, partial [Polyangiales bacterium]